MNITYKRAVIADAKEIVKIYDAAFYEDYVRFGVCPGYGKSVEDMEDSIDNNLKFIICADNIQAGVISVSKEGDKQYHIGCLCVIPEYQGKGIGSKTMQFIKEELSDWESFTLDTPAEKTQNVKFYVEKCGFMITEEAMDESVRLYNFRLMKHNPKDVIIYHLIEEWEKKSISDWHYEGEYAMYDMPSYEEQVKNISGFARPERKKNYYSYLVGEKIIGFTNILEEETEVFIGIGVNPNCCGNGYGQQILELAYRTSKALYPEKKLYLEVRTWNKRAVCCYEKAGFTIVGEPFEQTTGIGVGQFYRMERL